MHTDQWQQMEWVISAQQNGLPTKNHEMYTSTEMNGFTVHVV